MAYLPCDSYALCGISRSFPLLFPNERQVAHALLTRPPLIRPRRGFTVRLECVMHAASVHPEPGSNSRIIVYPIRSRGLDIYQSELSLALLLLLFVFRNQRVALLYNSSVVRFSRTVCSTRGFLGERAPIISQRTSVVNTFFEKNVNKFQRCFLSLFSQFCIIPHDLFDAYRIERYLI